jgi:hypothetical protein
LQVEGSTIFWQSYNPFIAKQLTGSLPIQKKMKAFKTAIASILISILFISCNSKKDYRYLSGFESYMAEVHQINLENTKSEVYYMMKVSGCNSCVTQNIQMLLELDNSTNLCLILIGTPEDEYTTEMYNSIQAKFNCLFSDEKMKVNSYETNLSKPILLHLSGNGEELFYMKVIDSEIPNAKKYIEGTEE